MTTSSLRRYSRQSSTTRGRCEMLKAWNSRISAKDYIRNGLVAMWDCSSANVTGSWVDEVSGYQLNWENGTGVIKTDGGISMSTQNTLCYADIQALKEITNNADAMSYEFVGDFQLMPGYSGWRGIANFCGVDRFLVNHTSDRYQSSVFIFGHDGGIGYNHSGRHSISGVGTRDRIFRYLDGSLVNEGSHTSTAHVEKAIVGFGVNGDQPRGGMMNNTIYCFRVYSRDLTAAEVAANYAIDKERFGLT